MIIVTHAGLFIAEFFSLDDINTFPVNLFSLIPQNEFCKIDFVNKQTKVFYK